MAFLSMARRTGWPIEDLEHPDEKAVAADDTDGDDGPDAESKDEEGDKLAAAA